MDAPPDTPAAFGPTPRTKVKRYPDRGAYDREVVYSILDAGLICHVGYVIEGQPFVTPTAYWREGDLLYWHGSAASRMLRTVGEGVPVCVTVTHVDGIVLARSWFDNSMNYRSVMAFGRAEPVQDAEEKRRVLAAFTDRVAPGRTAETRPPTEQELKATFVMRMRLAEVSAKVRTGPPRDEEADYALPCWAGVVPIRLVLDEPQADPLLPPGVPVSSAVRAIRLGTP